MSDFLISIIPNTEKEEFSGKQIRINCNNDDINEWQLCHKRDVYP